MEESYTQRLERKAIEEMDKLLARPIAPSAEYTGTFNETTKEPEYFDPWDIFPVYGNYSSSFDDMALKVLENLLNGEYDDEELAHEMFREMLCEKGLCDYGTSPRVCFPTTGFKKLLPKFISKWKQYYKLTWEETK